jgi:hypothetical protein
MESAYHDRWITCTEDAVTIRGYYFPWGSKTVPYTAIKSATRVPLGPLTGQARIWGTANPTLWANLDPRRMGKNEGLVLDLGRTVRPFVTPDDPDAFEAALEAHAVPVGLGGGKVV